MTMQERLAATMQKSRAATPRIPSSPVSASQEARVVSEVVEARNSLDEPTDGDVSETSKPSLQKSLSAPGSGESTDKPGNQETLDEPKPLDSPDKAENVGDLAAHNPLVMPTKMPEKEETELPALQGMPSLARDPSILETQSVIEPPTTEPDATLGPPTTHSPETTSRSSLEIPPRAEAEGSSSIESRLRSLLSDGRHDDNSSAPATDAIIAAKDRQLEQLLEEGKALSRKELRLNNTIKGLRKRIEELENELSKTKQASVKAEAERSDYASRLKQLQQIERRQADRIKTLSPLEGQVAQLRLEASDSAQLVKALQAQTAAQAARLEELDARRHELVSLRQEYRDLKEQHTNVVRDFGEQRNALLANLDKSFAERASLEQRLQAEIASLQSHTELYRAKAEEATSATSESQISRLLHQIETLHFQHSEQNKNWLQIESTLSQKTRLLSNELAQMKRQLAEAHASAKQSTRNTKRLEDEVVQGKEDCARMRAELAAERSRRAEAEDKLEAERAHSESQLSVQAEKLREAKLELEKQASVKASTGEDAWTNPVYLNSSRNLSLDSFRLPVSAGRPGPHRSMSWRSMFSTGDQGMTTRRSSVFSPEDVALDEEPSGPGTPVPRAIQESPPPDVLSPGRSLGSMQHPLEQEEFASMATSTKPSLNIGMLEKLSSVVRRLEGEAVVAREELARSALQKREAQEECAALLVQLDGMRAVQTELETARAEMAALEERHNTTLDLLGERSERLNEMQQDIADMKELYTAQIEDLVTRLNGK